MSGLGAVAGRYDTVLFDQFGVLHDGRAPFPGAVEAVRRLRATGARTAVISNSGKRAAANAARLERLGFEAGLFDVVMTSGEICHQRLAADLAAGRRAPGDAVMIVARDGDRSPVEGLDLAVGGAADAALLIIAGREPERHDLATEAAALAPLAARGVPCLCANPDRIMYAGDATAPGPGALAEAYAAAGGPVEMIGKPGRAIFEATLAALATADPARALMIGDSLEHDIAGAQAVGMATMLVRGGIQADTPAGARPPDHVIDR
ncbi:MAG: TIGR01459 family HAD-type hydrolase, partial [Pseudomonadota bacterium]